MFRISRSGADQLEGKIALLLSGQLCGQLGVIKRELAQHVFLMALTTEATEAVGLSRLRMFSFVRVTMQPKELGSMRS